MVKRAVSWEHAAPVTTPSQLRSYIESCKEWILAFDPNDSGEEVEVAGSQPIDAPVQSQKMASIGVTREDIHRENVFDCFICAENCAVIDSHVATANPFTRAQVVMLCKKCASA